MTDFVYDGTALPNGKLDAVPSPGPADQYVTAAEWNLAMQAMLDIRGSILTGAYHGTGTVRWLNASGVTQSRSWWDVANTRLVLAGDASGTTPYMHLTPATGTLGLGDLALNPTALSFSSSVGASGTDVAMKVGTRLADGSMNGAAKLLSIRSGIGATEVEHAHFSKGVGLTVGSSQVQSGGIGYFPVAAYSNLFRPASATSNATIIGSHSAMIVSEIAVKAGTSAADGSVNAGAKLLSVRTGIGATEVEYAYFTKAGFTSLGAISAPTLVATTGFRAQRIYWVNASDVNKSQSWWDEASSRQVIVGDSTGSTAWLYATTADGIIRSDYGFQTAQSVAATGLVSAGDMIMNPLSYSLSTSVPGPVSGDIILKVGTRLADGSVNAGAKLLSVRTGIGATEVEKAYFDKTGALYCGSVSTGGQSIAIGGAGGLALGSAGLTPPHSGFVMNFAAGWALAEGAATECYRFISQTTFADLDSQILTFRNSNLFTGPRCFSLRASGRIDQLGTDSSATPGAATINKPTGISAIASGTSSVTITNSLVPAVATKRIRIMVYFNGDHGAARSWAEQTAGGGSFVVNLSANASANTVFSWELAELL